jgi:Histidine kinase-, DNA gyrase B-, and HSP90-like ATPase
LSDHSYPVEVQSDFLEKITHAKPIHALAEFIWNSLDADATAVDVTVEHNALGAMSQIIVQDNGTGIEFEKAPELFKRLGGSWKHAGGTTKKSGRFLHGQDGRGRFKVFGLGDIAEWDVTYANGENLSTFKIRMTATNLKEVVISDQEKAPAGRQTGRHTHNLQPSSGLQHLNVQ